ncbi:hypothetical protein [Brevibacterium sp. CFH 10365]|uniref:hypothetical protein n=1 Tax=Brevibacterium sp. CFH 10365 TaxID=2585207 RepID=UPI001266316C|nr:hypothetical protein [Brevibacterium sp. CFH 10365]
MRTTVTIDIDARGAQVRIETDAEDPLQLDEQHDTDLFSMSESVGNRVANSIGFHANLEPEDGRYD